MQYPVEVRGVRVDDVPARVAQEAARVGMRTSLLERGVNDEFSGGEKKRAETVQLAVLLPKFAVLDEIDSGLDVDALRDVARRVEAMTHDDGLGVLAITHYARLLAELRADRIHVLMGGRIVASGGPELAEELEASGYEGLAAQLEVDGSATLKFACATNCQPVLPFTKTESRGAGARDCATPLIVTTAATS